MKKLVAYLLAALLCACSFPALAQQMSKADKARILPGMPPGMVATCNVTDGRVDILINTHATDWDMVATAARKSGSLVIFPGIKKPWDYADIAARTDYYWEPGLTAEQSEANTAGMLAQVKWGSAKNVQKACSYQGIAIGRYDEGTGVFIPQERAAGFGDGFAVRWKGNDGALLTECVRVSVKYTDPEAVYTSRRKAGRATVAANVKHFGKQLDTALVSDVDIEDGRIVYTLKSGAKGSEVFTAIAAPRWLNVDENWTARWTHAGGESDVDICSGEDYGLDNACVVVWQKISTEHILHKNDWAIQWLDENGRVRAVFSLEALFKVGEPKLTVAYDNTVEPVPAGSLSMTTQNPLNGLSPQYDGNTGELLLAIDENKLPPNGKTDLSLTNVTVGVTPPQGARNVKTYRIQGDVIYGDTGENQMELDTLAVTPGKSLVVPQLNECLYFRRLTAELSNGKLVSYFVSPSMVGEYGGTTIIFEWRDENGAQIGKRQQVTLKTDSYRLIERVNPSLTKNPNKLVDIPTIQTNMDGCFAVTAELPQSGDNVMRYEVALVDGHGNAVTPEEPVLMYLPYPQGKSMSECSGMAFAVYHQLADGSYEEFSTENGRLTLTEQGLCLHATSFSPYYLSWEAGGDTSLPDTGDDSSLAVCCFALLVSVACLCAAVRRRRSA